MTAAVFTLLARPPSPGDALSHQVQPRGFCSAGGAGLVLVLDKTTFKQNLCNAKEIMCLQ